MRDLTKRVRAVESNITWTYHSRFSAKHKYVTVAVPKVACSTIKRALHVFEGIGAADRLALEHGAGEDMRLARLKTKDAVDALTADDWLRFTFVRNPYDRLLSAWKSKVFSTHDTAYAAARQKLRERLGYPKSVNPEWPSVAFGDFVRCVLSGDAAFSRDGHWERQTVVGLHDVIPYDVVGRFENFNADFRNILERLHAPADVVALAVEVTNPTEYLPPAAAYDTALAALVYDYYRDDFERFGYERDSWHTPQVTAT
jgi:hypothetical protein